MVETNPEVIEIFCDCNTLLTFTVEESTDEDLACWHCGSPLIPLSSFKTPLSCAINS
ncbi:hypothetical protein LCGC14_2732460 [marine sediment metagenome]|uniref:Uncharacterized protein n=1 Tax=marine sediment metagenome TaxID=412755 RepID=A0A0F8Z6Y7_9ZZZZ